MAQGWWLVGSRLGPHRPSPVPTAPLSGAYPLVPLEAARPSSELGPFFWMPKSPLWPLGSSKQTMHSLLACNPGQGSSGKGQGQDGLLHKLSSLWKTFCRRLASPSEV